MRIKVNGETKEVDEGATLQRLVEQLSLAADRLAVELNYEVIRRAQWPGVTLSEGDRVEVVHFVGGG